MDVERAEARVQDTLGRRDSSGKNQGPSPIGHGVIDASVQSRLRRSLVRKVRIGRRRAVNRPARAQKRFLGQKPCRDLVGEPVADGGGVHQIDGKQAAPVVGLVDGRAIELPEANPDTRAPHLTGRLRDDIDHTAHRVRAPDCRGRTANHFDLFDLLRLDGQKIPHDGAEEILVDRASVEEHEERVGQRAGRGARRHIDVPGGCLRDIHTGDSPHEVGHHRTWRVADPRIGHDGHRGGAYRNSSSRRDALTTMIASTGRCCSSCCAGACWGRSLSARGTGRLAINNATRIIASVIRQSPPLMWATSEFGDRLRTNGPVTDPS